MPKIITNTDTSFFLGQISDLIKDAQKQDTDGIVEIEESMTNGILEFNEVRNGNRENGVLIGKYTGPESAGAELEFSIEDQEDNTKSITIAYPKMPDDTRINILNFLDNLLNYAAQMEFGESSYEAKYGEDRTQPETLTSITNFNEHWKDKMLKSFPEL